MMVVKFLTKGGETVTTLKFDKERDRLNELYKKIDEIIKKYPAIHRYEVWELVEERQVKE